MEKVTGFVGRERETDETLSATRRGANVLVSGRAGIGKSAFLRQLQRRLVEDDSVPPIVAVPDGTMKNALTALARQLHEHVGLALPEDALPPRTLARAKRDGTLPWSDLVRTLHRLPVPSTVNILIATLRKRRFLVFIESLEVPPSQAELFARIFDEAQVVAAMQTSNRRIRIERILWRFQERIELKPLPAVECETIASRWLERNPLRFASASTKRRFLRHIVQDSGGVPAAIRGMLEAAAKEEEITPAKARGFAHEAGVRYFDMTPTLIVVFVVAMATRYVARGIHDNELYIVSGVVLALVIGLRYLVFRFR